MKTFTFDLIGNMTISMSSNGVDRDGKPVAQMATHDIQPSQLKAHLPMFQADMSPAELYKANGIIAAFEAQ